MNSLSVFIWLAEIFESTKVLFGVISGMTMGGILLFNFWQYLAVEYYNTNHKEQYKFEFIFKKIFIVALCFALVSLIIPSRQTTYLIAASEMSEIVINDPKTQKVFDILADKIMKELGEESK